MVKKRRTLKATEPQVVQFKAKALQYSKAMNIAYESRLWDAAVSNGVHAFILMANAVTGRLSGEYYADKDHSRAPEYLVEVFGPDATKARNQMVRVLDLKGLVEYEARGCTAKDATDVVKRVERFLSWAIKQFP